MPIDLAAINWVPLGYICALVFVSSLIGQSVVGSNRLLGAVIAVIIFVGVYVFWNYYPHGLVPAFRFPKLT